MYLLCLRQIGRSTHPQCGGGGWAQHRLGWVGWCRRRYVCTSGVVGEQSANEWRSPRHNLFRSTPSFHREHGIITNSIAMLHWLHIANCCCCWIIANTWGLSAESGALLDLAIWSAIDLWLCSRRQQHLWWIKRADKGFLSLAGADWQCLMQWRVLIDVCKVPGALTSNNVPRDSLH